MNLNFNFPYIVLCFWHIPQTRGITPMMILKYHVQKLMHVAITHEFVTALGEDGS